MYRFCFVFQIIALFSSMSTVLYAQDTEASLETTSTIKSIIEEMKSENENYRQILNQQTLFEKEADDRLDDFSQQLSQFKTIGIMFSVVVSLVGLLGALGVWKYLGKTVSNKSDEIISKKVDEAEIHWKTDLEKRMEIFEKHVKKQIDEINKSSELICLVIGLRHARKYSQAIELTEWNGTPEALTKYPQYLQKLLVECAGRLRSGDLGGRGEHYRSQAWISAQNIASTNDSEDVSFLLREAMHHQEYEDGVEFYEYALQKKLPLEDECHRRASVLYRHCGQNKKALDLASKYSHGSNIHHKNTLATLLSDNGQIDEAYTMLSKELRLFIDLKDSQKPKGWHLVATTFINICNELGQPENGIDAAKVLLQETPDSVSLYNCGCLARKLPDDSSDKEFIFKKLHENLLTQRNATSELAHALLLDYEQGWQQATEYLKNQIENLKNKLLDENTEQRKQAKLETDIARLTTLKSELLLENEQYPEAKTCLLTVATNSIDRFGDLSYLLARCCMHLNDELEAVALLESAFGKKKKWETMAHKDPIFKKSKHVTDLLAKRIAPAISQERDE